MPAGGYDGSPRSHYFQGVAAMIAFDGAAV
jgi:hypothetical protein